MLLTGHCHCANIRFDFETGYTPQSLPLRACQCSFCRAHGVITTSDPHGRVRFIFDDAGFVQRYRFGLRVTDMLICKRCGCYVAAIMNTDGRRYATLNANLFDSRAELTVEPAPVDYSAESAKQRVTRRIAHWTPVTGSLDVLTA